MVTSCWTRNACPPPGGLFCRLLQNALFARLSHEPTLSNLGIICYSKHSLERLTGRYSPIPEPKKKVTQLGTPEGVPFHLSCDHFPCSTPPPIYYH